MVNKMRYALYRILFMIYSVFCILTLSLGGFLLAPLSSYYFFNDFRFWKYYRYFFPMFKATLRFTRLWLTSEAYRRSFALSLTAPPMTSPDLSIVKVKSTWNADVFVCNQCTKCCQHLACPLVDEVNNGCLSYNSFFWRYFACGRYPINQQQIDYYDCPKWEIRV